jgi:hypothetical protein
VSRSRGEEEFFNEWISRARIERNLLLWELAAQVGVSVTMLKRYIVGDCIPRMRPRSRKVPLGKLALFAEALDTPLDYVVQCWQKSMDSTPAVIRVLCQAGKHDLTQQKRHADGACRECKRERAETRKGTGFYRERHQRQQDRKRAMGWECTEDGCHEPPVGLELCQTHYTRHYHGLPMNPEPPGLVRQTRAGTWSARIKYHNAEIHLGTYATQEEARHWADVGAAERAAGVRPVNRNPRGKGRHVAPRLPKSGYHGVYQATSSSRFMGVVRGTGRRPNEFLWYQNGFMTAEDAARAREPIARENGARLNFDLRTVASYPGLTSGVTARIL